MRHEVGAYVRTRFPLYGRRRLGRVIRRDGAYVYVRLNYRGIEAELYDCELEKGRQRNGAEGC